MNTTVVIDFSRGREPAYSRLTALLQSHAEVGVCAVTPAEFYAGLPRSAHPTWDAFFNPLEYLPQLEPPRALGHIATHSLDRVS